MADAVQSRRKFILTLIAGAAALAGLGRYLKPNRKRETVVVSADVADVPSEGALVFKEERVAVVRNEAGFQALSLVCTHLGCIVTVTPEGLFCPCHGSRFNRKGEVLQGPATHPLPKLMVEVRGDQVTVSN